MAFAFQCCALQNRYEKAYLVRVIAQSNETVLVADAALLSDGAGPSKLSKDTKDLLQAPFATLLAAIGQNTVLRNAGLFRSKVVEFVAVGARNFHAPNGLGRVLSETCYVIKLTKPGLVDIERQSVGSVSAQPNGAQVRTWNVDLGEGAPRRTTIYVSQPDPNYVLLSNSATQIREVDASLRTGAVSATQQPIPEASRASGDPIWGYRRYRPNESAAERQASGALNISPTAIALIFFVDPAVESATIQYFSSSGRDETAKHLSTLTGLPFAASGPTEWDASLSLLNPSDQPKNGS